MCGSHLHPSLSAHVRTFWLTMTYRHSAPEKCTFLLHLVGESLRWEALEAQQLERVPRGCVPEQRVGSQLHQGCHGSQRLPLGGTMKDARVEGERKVKVHSMATRDKVHVGSY